jgi:hypothetical protein
LPQIAQEKLAEFNAVVSGMLEVLTTGPGVGVVILWLCVDPNGSERADFLVSSCLDVVIVDAPMMIIMLTLSEP